MQCTNVDFQAADELNVMEYITVASTGDATDFGDLSVGRHSLASMSNKTRGLWAGGLSGAYSDVIDYVTIASTGNAVDFGDIDSGNYELVGTSDVNGGLV